VWPKTIIRLQRLQDSEKEYKNTQKAEKESFNGHYKILQGRKYKNSLRSTDISTSDSEKTFHT